MQGLQEQWMENRWDGSRADEETLLGAARTGDPWAMERLLALHERSLYALCRGMLGHAEDAEDAVQETFLRALRALCRFRERAAFRTWLFRIAINVCLDWKEARRPQEPWNEHQPDRFQHAPSPEIAVLRQLHILEALRTLRPQQRAVLLLKELEGWSVAEVAAAMGWNEKRVQNELYRARCTLADWRQRQPAEGDER